MEGLCIQNRTQNLFLPPIHQIAEYIKMHEQKVKEYENYLSYLQCTISNTSRNSPKEAFHVEPPTPVTLAFSHLSSPTTNPFCHIKQDYFVNNFFNKPFESIYVGEEANIWGPGQLGLFAKTPNQLEELPNTSHTSLEHKTIPITKKQPNPIQISDAARLQASCISSPKSSIPPGFEHQCSAAISMRDEMFMVNRSM
jgi:hypothetical protein